MHISHFVCSGLWRFSTHPHYKQPTFPQSSSVFCWPGRTTSLCSSPTVPPRLLPKHTDFALEEAGLFVRALCWFIVFQEGGGIKGPVQTHRPVGTHRLPTDAPTLFHRVMCLFLHLLSLDANLSRLWEYSGTLTYNCPD